MDVGCMQWLQEELRTREAERDASRRNEEVQRERAIAAERKLAEAEERVTQLKADKEHLQQRNCKYFEDKMEAQDKLKQLIKVSFLHPSPFLTVLLLAIEQLLLAPFTFLQVSHSQDSILFADVN